MKRILCTGVIVASILVGRSAVAEENYDETYFSNSEVQNWEQTILVNADNDIPTGDTKANGGRVYRSATGSWSWRDGIICVTDSRAKSPLFNNGHAAIVAVAPYYDATIEANPSDGVQPKYGHWNTRFAGSKVYQYGVLKTSVAQDQNAAKWAAKHIGKGYNHNFFDIGRRDKFYCSQLVWAAYKDTSGADIGTWEWGHAIHPFELMSSKETTLLYRNK
ncbi:hypothetical protein G7055_05860 [Streptococcus pyogenes]|nr:hypothetical protein G7055_05860 [Streptococcus pyogenes]